MAENVAEELSRLAKLRDEGLLTPEEFEQRKAVLLRAAPATPAKSHTARNLGIGCLGIVIVLAVIGAIAGGGGKNPPLVAGNSQEAEAASSAPGVTMAQYNQLRNGMSYQEASKVLGSPGTEVSQNEIGGIHTAMYMWEGTSPGANMNAMFQNNKLIQKAQLGLN